MAFPVKPKDLLGSQGGYGWLLEQLLDKENNLLPGRMLSGAARAPLLAVLTMLLAWICSAILQQTEPRPAPRGRSGPVPLPKETPVRDTGMGHRGRLLPGPLSVHSPASGRGATAHGHTSCVARSWWGQRSQSPHAEAPTYVPAL